MDNKCKRCISMAINPHLHGRGKDHLDLCDVCYWRERAERLQGLVEKTKEGLKNIAKHHDNSFWEDIEIAQELLKELED